MLSVELRDLYHWHQNLSKPVAEAAETTAYRISELSIPWLRLPKLT